MDDGQIQQSSQYNVGSTMQYHPHGDASINDAIVNIGQKDLLIRLSGKLGRHSVPVIMLLLHVILKHVCPSLH
jgi:DNA gyrase/topoisomerase IV subunit A